MVRITLSPVALGCLLVVGALLGGGAPVSAADSELPAQPNIVMIYLDDVAPVEALWNDPVRTPNIYDNFIARGVHLDHAIGETPLCCPSRANLLTGLHTHNTRVVRNDAQLFDPSETIGKAMIDAGYASMYIGKYLNRDDSLTDEQWAAHDANWTDLDVIEGVNGAFYDYDLHTKDGTQRIKGLHSTQMVANRAVMHFQETPAEQPIFAVLAIYDLHAPNSRQAQDKGDPRCANMPPWDPPNYNEADMSDKPAALQDLPMQPFATGWPMVTYCEEMLGVDRAVGQVTAELAAEGRLDNTVLMFTADNGMTWGQHRLGASKSWPYATPVPLYVRWPAAHWGDAPQTNSEVVSDIDFAPTICALAGPACQLGPFARGSSGPDGLSLVPLLNGDTANLGRDAVLEESYASADNSWSGLRTTAVFDPNKRWHYIEYTNGERELYDLANDPWELNNLARGATYESLMATLHDRLAQLRLEGIGAGTGTIIIRENASPDYGFDYQFHGDLGDFVLDDDGGTNSAHADSATFANLPSGAYTITRAANAPWSFAGADCDGVGVSSNALGQVTIYLHPTETVTCTWIDAVRQPDMAVSLTKSGTSKGDNVYATAPVKKQTLRRDSVAVGRTYSFYVHLQNDSGVTDFFTLHTASTGPGTVSVRYIQAGTNVTQDVLSGDYSPYAKGGGTINLRINVTIGKGTPKKSVFTLVVTALSASDPSKVDVIKIVAAR